MLRAIQELFIGKHFDFYTPYDLQEFDILLALLSERDHLKYPSWRRPTTVLQISSHTADYDRVTFTGNRETTAKFQIDVDGLVEASPAGAHIIGDVKLRKVKTLYLDLMIVFAILSVVIMSILMTKEPVGDSIVIGLACFGVMSLGSTLELMLSQHRVYTQIQQGLGISKKKKNDES